MCRHLRRGEAEGRLRVGSLGLGFGVQEQVRQREGAAACACEVLAEQCAGVEVQGATPSAVEGAVPGSRAPRCGRVPGLA